MNSKSSSWSQCFSDKLVKGVALANSRFAKCQSRICRSREERYTSLKNKINYIYCIRMGEVITDKNLTQVNNFSLNQKLVWHKRKKNSRIYIPYYIIIIFLNSSKSYLNMKFIFFKLQQLFVILLK